MKDGVGVRDENGDRGEMRVKMEGGKGVGIAAEDEPGMGLGWSWTWDRETPVRLDLWRRHGIGVRNKDSKGVGDRLEVRRWRKGRMVEKGKERDCG